MSDKLLCQAEKKVALEILQSWSSDRSNTIIVAPPFSRPRIVFDCLASASYRASNSKDLTRRLAIAKLDTANFKSESDFVAATLSGWGIAPSSSNGAYGPIERLELGVRSLTQRGIRPVLLIQRFHEALDKLGEDIGTSLRNLEHDQALITVVELPITLQTLRERWDLQQGKSPFLASDWGQGHRSKLLKGFNQDEIRRLLNGVLNDGEVSETIFQLTSGLPILVERILGEYPMNKRAIVQRARNDASALCGRLIKWIDRPNENTYKRALANALHGFPADVSIGDHDWRDVLSGDEGGVRPTILAWASVKELLCGTDEIFFGNLRLLIRTKKYAEASNILSAHVGFRENRGRGWAALKHCLDFAIASDPFNPSWASSLESLLHIEGFIASNDSDKYSTCLKKILLWKEFCANMADFDAAASREKGLRVEEFVSKHQSPLVLIDSFLLLASLRLEAAREMSDYQFVKTIIEQPESLVQVYAFIKYGIKFWCFEGCDSDAGARISAVIRKEFKMPALKSRLGYVELLYLCHDQGYVSLRSCPVVPTIESIRRMESIYEIRKQQVHSQGFVSPGEAVEYYRFCFELIGLLRTNVDGLGSGGEPTSVMEVAEYLLDQIKADGH